MEPDDYKKYNVLENILQKVNQKYIALSPEETKRNNKLLTVIDGIVQTLRNKSVLFNSLYQKNFYGGSFYDGLKVGKPSEYDLDCVLCLPKIAEPTVVVSDKPGFVHIVLNLDALEKKKDEAPKYPGLADKLLVGNRLSTSKVKSWMESLVSSAVTGNKKKEINMDDSKMVVTYKLVKSGPALTVKIYGEHNGDVFNVDIDLVPCFTFSAEQWPRGGYRVNPSKNKDTFFVVPKSPSDEEPLHWRLSFQEQERELISGYSVMKPTIRLLKKIRDRHQHKIASYYIKTVFLWELGNIDKNLWNKPLSFIFAMMLKKYSEYVERKSIPYYWNESNNLISDLPDMTASCIANKVRNIVEHIDKICNKKSEPYGIISFLLNKEEFDLDTFKQEVPLQKKFLKQIEAVKVQETQPIPAVSDKARSPASSDSSVASSFEEISKDMLHEESTSTSSPNVLDIFTKLETMCLSLASEQKRMFGLLETVLEKVESCESQIKDLSSVVQSKCWDDLRGAAEEHLKRDSKWNVDEILRPLSAQCSNNLSLQNLSQFDMSQHTQL